MKVYMKPRSADFTEENGIRQVCRAYEHYLLPYGVEWVDDPNKSDIRVGHAGSLPTDIDVCISAGLYWTADMISPSWELKENAKVISAMRHASEIIVPSTWVARNFARDLRVWPNVINHGIDITQWEGEEIETPYVLWAKNRASDACDPTPVAELAKRAPSIAFLSTFFKGDPPHNVTVTGTVPHDTMKTMIQQCGIYMSSTQETFGVATLEAMASGKPILGFNWGGNKDLVKHGVNGYLAVPKDYDDLFNGLLYCIENRKILGDNSREIAKQFTWEAAAAKVWDVFRSAEREQEPTVSIVIPVYNYADKVGRAIESALSQTYPCEIIVVDDGSEDNSAAVAEEYAGKHGNVHVIRQDNRGVAAARNAGIERSTGKYVVCLDADDAIKPTFVDSLLPALESDRSLGIAYTGLWYITPDGREGLSPWPPEFNPDHQASGFNQIPTACMFRREMWERLGGYQPRCCPRGAGFEDADFWLRANEYGWGAKKATDEPLFIYSWMSGRVSSSNVQDILEEEKEYYINWYPWFTDGHRLFASQATPYKYSHPVRTYDQPGVSIVIPVGPDHLDVVSQALDSVESQTYRKWEAIVVIDSDKDDPLIYKLKRTYPYVKWLTTPHKGAGYARNRGAELAEAPLLLFLDADDWLYPDFLEQTLHAHTDTGYAVYTDYIGIADVEDLDKLPAKLRRRVGQYDGKRAWIAHQAFDFDCNRALNQPEDPPWLWCNITTVIRTDWHFQIGGFDETMDSWEDYLYWIRMARAGICFHRIPTSLMVYRFYTGERRDRAHHGQNWVNLIQYVKKVIESEDTVGCRGCSQKRSVPSRVATLPTPTTREVVNMNDSDFRMCVYKAKNIGDHLVTSVVPEIEARGGYGYRATNDRFLVHVADIQAKPDKFQVEEIKVPAMTAKAVSAPKPVTMEDIVEDPLVKLARVKEEAKAAAAANVIMNKPVPEKPEPIKEPEAKPKPEARSTRKRTRRVKVESD